MDIGAIAHGLAALLEGGRCSLAQRNLLLADLVPASHALEALLLDAELAFLPDLFPDTERRAWRDAIARYYDVPVEPSRCLGGDVRRVVTKLLTMPDVVVVFPRVEAARRYLSRFGAVMESRAAALRQGGTNHEDLFLR